MGLDFAETIISLETTFGIDIEDEECKTISTPQDLIDIIAAKVTITEQESCSNLKSFNILRRVLVNNFGAKRKVIKLETPIKDIVDIKDEKQFWTDLQEALSASHWPQITFPYTIYLLKILLMIITSIYLLLKSDSFLAVMLMAFLNLISVGIIEVFYSFLGKKFGYKIHHRYKTVKDFLELIRSSKYFKWTIDDISNEVRKTVIEISGIKPDIYREDAHFVRDLGFG